MTNPIKIGLSGLAAASARLEVSANNIANVNNTKSAGFADTVEGLTSRQAYQPKQVRLTPMTNGGVSAQITNAPIGAEVSLAEEIVQLKVAQHTYNANAAVIKTALEVEDTMLETFSKPKN